MTETAEEEEGGGREGMEEVAMQAGPVKEHVINLLVSLHCKGTMTTHCGSNEQPC